MTEDKTADFGQAATTQEAFRLIHAGPTQTMTATLVEDTVVVMEAATAVVDMAAVAIMDAETIMVSSVLPEYSKEGIKLINYSR